MTASSAPSLEIVDGHQHIGEMSNVLPRGRSPHVAEVGFEADVAERIRLMDAREIAWALLQPIHGYLKPDGLKDTMRVNDQMARYKRHAPSRFRAVFGTVEPTYGERGIAEIDRCRRELGLDGMSWHHRFQGCYIDNKWMWPLLEHMANLGMSAVFHTNAESSLEAPWRLLRLAKDFPAITFLAFDGLWTFERAGEITFLAADYPNVIWDIGGPANYIAIEDWVARNGASTISFSNDAPFSKGDIRKAKLREQIERANIGDADKALILGGNLKRMITAP